jgi:hypothetical protein
MLAVTCHFQVYIDCNNSFALSITTREQKYFIFHSLHPDLGSSAQSSSLHLQNLPIKRHGCQEDMYMIHFTLDNIHNSKKELTLPSNEDPLETTQCILLTFALVSQVKGEAAHKIIIPPLGSPNWKLYQRHTFVG